MYENLIRTSQETYFVSDTKLNRLMLLTKTTENTRIHSVGRMQNFCMLKYVVYTVEQKSLPIGM
jgi:hypothetical protein